MKEVPKTSDSSINPVTQAIVDELARIHVSVLVLENKLNLLLQAHDIPPETIHELRVGAESQLTTTVRTRL